MQVSSNTETSEKLGSVIEKELGKSWEESTTQNLLA